MVLAEKPPHRSPYESRVLRSLTGIKFILVCLLLIGAVAFVLTALQPGGPF
jgi:hypothetical protein